MRDTVSRERTWCAPSQFPLLTPDGNPRPWVDEMIGRANEVLNALLRLQKHQLAAQQEKRRMYYYVRCLSNASSLSFFASNMKRLSCRESK